jgi:hypothetical protein
MEIFKKTFFQRDTEINKQLQEESNMQKMLKKVHIGVCPVEDCGGNLFYGSETQVSVNVACSKCLKLFCLSPSSIKEIGTITSEQLKMR